MNFCAVLLGFEQIIFINYFQMKQRDDIIQIMLSILKFYSLKIHTFLIIKVVSIFRNAKSDGYIMSLFGAVLSWGLKLFPTLS